MQLTEIEGFSINSTKLIFLNHLIFRIDFFNK